MTINMYCVFDKVSKEFAPPFVAKNDEVAKRFFRNSLDSNTKIVESDFDLFYIGKFDNDNASLSPEGIVSILTEFTKEDC